MKSLRVVFMGTPDFAVPCLEALLAAGHEVAAVITQPDRPRGRGRKLAFSPVKACAVEHGLEVLQPEKIKTPEFEQVLRELAPDVMVVVAFGQILSPAILAIPPCGCINVHASLLPYYRGAAPIHWAIMQGEKKTGVTTMYMDEGLDTGDMILKKEIAILQDASTGDIHDELMQEGARLLQETLALIAEGKAPRTKQDHAVSTYAPLLKAEIEQLDWNHSAQELHNRIRGLSPWPGAYCRYAGGRLKVWKSRVCEEAAAKGAIPGRIARLSVDGFVVETGNGLLELLEVQPENKRRMKASECACGYSLQPGDRLV
nr:methionyl-tRNA formyltransferase [uncultured Anaeromusa sp.]